MAIVSRYVFIDNVSDVTNAFHGTASSITYSAKPTGYNFDGKVANFNGTSSKITFGNHLGTNYTEYSICFWIKAEATSESATLYQRSHTTDAGAVAATRSVLNTNSDFALGIDDYPPSGGGLFTNAWEIIINHWYFVCYTRTGNTRNIYVNGVNVKNEINAEVYSGVTPNFSVFGQDLRETNRNRWFKGQLGDLRIYNHCLSGGEINNIYKAESPTPVYGGAILRLSSGEIVHNFYYSGSLNTNSRNIGNLSYLLVAGGGGGGGSTGGGGGAGGFLTGSTNILANTYSIVVGSGGAGGLNKAAGTNGGNTTAFSLISYGGGGGGATSGGNNGFNAGSGGSGGGGAKYGTGIANTGSGTTGQGNRGGYVSTGGYNDVKMGGGGGAGQVGYDSPDGRGGAGLQSSISGAATWYAGGGGAGLTGGGAAGGVGGGGAGDDVGNAGRLYTGGGGGGGWLYASGAGGAGGSGIAILRYDPIQFINNASLLLNLLPKRSL